MWDRIVCVTPADAVVTLEDAKRNLRLDAEDTDFDAELTGHVAAAQALIEGPGGIGVAIAASTWRASLDAWPAASVVKIPLRPVTSIVSITYVDPNGQTQTLAANTDYIVDLDQTPAVIAPTPGKTLPPTRRQPGAIKITFAAGPETPDANLVAAVHVLVAHFFEPESDDLPPAWGRIVDRYGQAL